MATGGQELGGVGVEVGVVWCYTTWGDNSPVWGFAWWLQDRKPLVRRGWQSEWAHRKSGSISRELFSEPAYTQPTAAKVFFFLYRLKKKKWFLKHFSAQSSPTPTPLGKLWGCLSFREAAAGLGRWLCAASMSQIRAGGDSNKERDKESWSQLLLDWFYCVSSYNWWGSGPYPSILMIF